jgi:hypothetical protein
MAIEGVPTFERSGNVSGIDVNGRAALAVAALEVVYGSNWDREKAQEDFHNDFGEIVAQLGDDRPIETYPHMPFASTTEGQKITVESAFGSIDGMQRRDGTTYPSTYPFREDDGNISKRLWTLGEGYDEAEVNRMNMPGDPYDPQATTIHARAALVDGPREEERLLHLLGLPHDSEAPDYSKGDKTQVEELARLTTEFEAAHPGLTHRAVILGGFAALTIQRRLEGRAGVEKKMPIEWGWMAIPYLGRKTMDGGSWVGCAGSSGGQPRLDRWDGDALPGVSLGLSVGLKEN